MSYSSKNPYGNKTVSGLSKIKGASYSSKNPYGNKTTSLVVQRPCLSYSSKNPYGNKTGRTNYRTNRMSYSSKNPYGNKTSNTCYHIFKNNKILSILNSYRYIKFSFYIIFYHFFCLLKCTYSFIYINIIYLLIII